MPSGVGGGQVVASGSSRGPLVGVRSVRVHCKKTRPSRVVSDHPGVSPRVPWMDGTIQGCLGCLTAQPWMHGATTPWMVGRRALLVAASAAGLASMCPYCILGSDRSEPGVRQRCVFCTRAQGAQISAVQRTRQISSRKHIAYAWSGVRGFDCG